jgi:sterol desaturase/sphingolipid hydroxylase (fatty acid hydroxylase superfamily)
MLWRKGRQVNEGRRVGRSVTAESDSARSVAAAALLHACFSRPQLMASIIAPRKLGDSSRVAADTASVHTPTMTLKTAALVALIGTILATVFLTWTFVMTVLNVLRGLAPAVMLFPWFVYAVACFSVAVFFTCSIGRSRDFDQSATGPCGNAGVGNIEENDRDRKDFL